MKRCAVTGYDPTNRDTSDGRVGRVPFSRSTLLAAELARRLEEKRRGPMNGLSSAACAEAALASAHALSLALKRWSSAAWRLPGR